MTPSVPDFSEQWWAAAEQAQASLVHVAAGCRRGASGSIYSDDGLVLTTARGVAGQTELEVVQGEQTSAAKVLGYDAATDLAVLRLESPFGKAPAWDTSPLRLGTLVLVGSRPGRGARVRSALVSQLGAAWHTPRGARIERYAELDLAPEPGFSGGLAFDAQGRAVGMSSAGLLRGVPLLLEKATLDRVVTALVAGGRVRRGYLGVGTQAVRLPAASVQVAGQASGLLVSSVQAGSAADRAQVAIGDVLLTLGSASLSHAGALQAALEDSEAQALPLALLRGGQKLSLDVTPGARP